MPGHRRGEAEIGAVTAVLDDSVCFDTEGKGDSVRVRLVGPGRAAETQHKREDKRGQQECLPVKACMHF